MASHTRTRIDMRNLSGIGCIYIGLLYMVLTTVDSEEIDKCPTDWLMFESSCYLFHKWMPLPRDNAIFKCGTHGGGLVSVTDKREHDFLVQWVERHDTERQTWYTSGVSSSGMHLGGDNFLWQATGEVIKEDLLLSVGFESNHTSGAVVYTDTDVGYQFGVVDPSESLPYICEVPLQESYRIVQEHRGFDYGMATSDVESLEKGPHFIVQPESTVVVGNPDSFTLECTATGKPVPVYSWSKGPNLDIPVNSKRDPRYLITNGKLVIKNPTESRDSTKFRCQAENKHGVIISDIADISFGYLGEFSNVKVAPVRAVAYQGAAIECSRITYNPGISYQWYKNSATQFVRPSYQKYIFISQNGKLYFSEVTSADEGQYYCITILAGRGHNAIGISQPPTRTSLPISLMVLDQAPLAEWGPEIQDEFIAVFPKPPLRGQNVHMECFAYGSTTAEFKYTWVREGKQLPKNARLMNHNRVLLLKDASLDDQGVYTCSVSRGNSAKDQRSIHLKLGSKPYFITPIGDQHVDVGAHFTWHCDVRSNPASTFKWYKDGQPLISDPQKSIHVINNVVTFSKLDPELHDGMYQCASTNVHGTTLSEGQLRVLAIAPTFAKNPLPPETRAPLSGNTTLACRPDAAPLAHITWLKDGVELPETLGVYEQRLNGDLVLMGVQESFAGRYTCHAANQFGEAKESTSLEVAEGTQITVAPRDQRIIVNATAFFYCVASSAAYADLLYTWYFNGYLIDPKLRPEFDIVQENSFGKTGLYIQGLTVHHTGVYECRATTTINSDSRSAYLTVIGPPVEPAGVFIDSKTITETSVVISWTETYSASRSILRYIVQSQSEFEDDDHWETAISNLPATETMHEMEDKRFVNVTGLDPGCGFRFRVIGVNEVGRSPPSVPTGYVTLRSAPPRVSPLHVGGGGGSVGILTMAWQPLTRTQQGGSGIGYQVYWRKKDGREQREDRWITKRLNGRAKQLVKVVGVNNFYLEYEVKVQPFNREGPGPNSSVVTVMSAEGLPMATPTNVMADGYNGTAMEITWIPVKQARDTVRGKILGYQISYWHEEDDPALHKKYIRYEGQVDTGYAIGLKSDNFYYFTVQVYNSAGLGPYSEFYFQETLHAPAWNYPKEVRVFSRGGNKVEVWWRGVTVSQPQSAIDGYVIYYWPAHEHYRTATMKYVDHPLAVRTVIQVEPRVVYALRVSAFSAGGLGKKSDKHYFTLEGNNIMLDYSLAQSVDLFLSASGRDSLTSSLVATWAALTFNALCLFYILRLSS